MQGKIEHDLKLKSLEIVHIKLCNTFFYYLSNNNKKKTSGNQLINSLKLTIININDY